MCVIRESCHVRARHIMLRHAIRFYAFIACMLAGMFVSLLACTLMERYSMRECVCSVCSLHVCPRRTLRRATSALIALVHQTKLSSPGKHANWHQSTHRIKCPFRFCRFGWYGFRSEESPVHMVRVSGGLLRFATQGKSQRVFQSTILVCFSMLYLQKSF